MAHLTGSSSGWARELAQEDRRLGDDARSAEAELKRRKEQFASAATEMMTRLRTLFEDAASSFNASSPSQPVAVTRLKGLGFAVSRGDRRLSVLKSADWNVVFSFADPPKADLLAILSRLEANGVAWHLYRKRADEDRFEAMPVEPGDLAERVSEQLFVRLVQASGPRAYRRRR
jgi:hypothetical protein